MEQELYESRFFTGIKESARLIFSGRTGRYSHPSALAPILLQTSNRFFRPSLCDCRDARIARAEFAKILLGLFVR
jgi:hypothetical protein